MAICPGFAQLPDVVLLTILRNLPTGDIVNLSQVNNRLNRLCTEKAIVKRTNFEGCYHVSEEDIRFYMNNAAGNIECLNFNHCYWLPQRVLQWAINKCKHLKELHVIECKLRTETLVHLVASLPSLTALSFSIASFADIKQDVFSPAKETLRTIQKLHVYYTSTELTIMNYLGEHTTILDHCDNLKHLLIGSAGMAVPELYRPIISRPQSHCRLEVMTITNNIHAGAQMFFYGTLSQLPNANIKWRSLLMPNVNFCEFSKKPELLSCFSHIEELQDLDVSGSKVSFPNTVMKMDKAANLRYLNLKATLVTSKQLSYIAAHCPLLTSINLYGCTSALREVPSGPDGSGVEELFKNCQHLQHVNMAGEHHHIHPPVGGPQLKHMLTKLKGLRSLSVPTCMLCRNDPSSGTFRTGKRTIKSALHSNKMRITHNGPVPVQVASSSSSESMPSTSSGTSTRQALNSDDGMIMNDIVPKNPQLEELEIIAVKFDSVFQRNRFINPKQPQFNPCVETRFVRDYDLEAISRLTNLKRLILAGLPGLISGHSLVCIAEGCRKLEFMSLAYLGGPSFSGALCKALPFCKKLKDLRIEQPHMALSAALFDALSQCDRLQRLCIIAKHSSFTAHDIHRLVDKLSQLYVVQVFAGGTLTHCRSLSTAIQRKHLKNRPGLSVAFCPLLYDGVSEVVSNLPAKHLEELTRFDSRVSMQPPKFNNTLVDFI